MFGGTNFLRKGASMRALTVLALSFLFDLSTAQCDDPTGSALCATISNASEPPQVLQTETMELQAQPLTIPTCIGYAKYPASSCYQYYECVPTVALTWAVLLQTCPTGYAYDPTMSECRLTYLVDCATRGPVCSAAGRYAASSCYQYYECQYDSFGWQPVLQNCAFGLAFNLVSAACNSISLVDCQNRVTTPAPPVVTTCTGPGRYAAPSCYYYYECQAVSWGWNPVLTACVTGQAFDVTYLVCAPVASVSCQQRLTTTTTQATPVGPTCTMAAKYPSPSCYYYYECEALPWGWDAVLKSCVEGQAFNSALLECAPFALVDCSGRVTTTSTTTPTPIVRPACAGPGRYSSPNCYQYYECQVVPWGWDAALLTCVTGYAFDVYLVACAPAAAVDCQSRLKTALLTEE